MERLFRHAKMTYYNDFVLDIDEVFCNRMRIDLSTYKEDFPLLTPLEVRSYYDMVNDPVTIQHITDADKKIAEQVYEYVNQYSLEGDINTLKSDIDEWQGYEWSTIN